MNAQEVGNTLNALGKVGSASSAMSLLGWTALAEAAERTAPGMNDQNMSNTIHAYAVLSPHVAATLSPAARGCLEAAAEREAPNMTSEERRGTLVWACDRLGIKIPSALRSTTES